MVTSKFKMSVIDSVIEWGAKFLNYNVKNISDAVTAEETRAKAAEKVNADAIAAEAARAKAVENSLSQNAAGVIDLTDYKAANTQLPTVNAVFKNGNYPAHMRSTFVSLSEYDVLNFVDVDGKTKTVDAGQTLYFFCYNHSDSQSGINSRSVSIFNQQKVFVCVVNSDYATSKDNNVAFREFGELCATTNMDGLMSKADKVKLDNIKIDASTLFAAVGNTLTKQNLPPAKCYAINASVAFDVKFYSDGSNLYAFYDIETPQGVILRKVAKLTVSSNTYTTAQLKTSYFERIEQQISSSNVASADESNNQGVAGDAVMA